MRRIRESKSFGAPGAVKRLVRTAQSWPDGSLIGLARLASSAHVPLKLARRYAAHAWLGGYRVKQGGRNLFGNARTIRARVALAEEYPKKEKA